MLQCLWQELEYRLNIRRGTKGVYMWEPTKLFEVRFKIKYDTS
jgi:hypothetical protein